MIDLFGNETESFEVYEQKCMQGRESDIQRFKRANHYRKSDNKDMRCGECEQLINKRMHSKNYHKCQLIGDSNGEATDIRVGNVCDKFKRFK